MSKEGIAPLNNEGKVKINEDNHSITQIKSEEKSTVICENISSSNEQRGIKRSLEEESFKPDLPQALKDMFKPLKCELCNVAVSSTIVAYTHYEGKTHKKNINAYMRKHHNVENTIKVKKSSEPTKCEICNITVSSEIAYKQHLAGKQHRKNLIRSKVETFIPVSKSEVDPTGRFGIGQAFLKENEQPSQSTPSSLQTALYCEICNVFTDTEKQMLIHKEGSKHSKNLAKRKFVEKLSLPQTKKQVGTPPDVWQTDSDD